MKASTSGQIPLPLRRLDHYLLEHYWPGRNRHVLDHLAAIGTDAAARLYLWGETGTGKSHLLQAMCTQLAGLGGRGVYVPLSEHDSLRPDYLEGLEQLDLIGIDDLEAVAGNSDWERAIFNLYNRLLDTGSSLIVTASASPNGVAVALPDLRSRLQQCTVFHLLPLSEAERLTALRERARLRGMELSEEVTAYLARRVPRGTHQLFQLLDRLDRASLAEKKRLTVPFVRQLLASEGFASEESGAGSEEQKREE